MYVSIGVNHRLKGEVPFDKHDCKQDKKKQQSMSIVHSPLIQPNNSLMHKHEAYIYLLEQIIWKSRY